MKDVHLREILEFGYGHLTILSVQAPLEIAIERARQRWWDGRRDLTRELGGRFISDAVVRSSYRPDGTSKCHTHAVELQAAAQHRQGLHVELLTVTSDHSRDQ
jgi:hypothetical protein